MELYNSKEAIVVAKKIIELAREDDSINRKLQNGKLDEEYYYMSLPFCVLDAVFSVGIHYTCVKKVVKNYCEKYNLPRWKNDLECGNGAYIIHTVSDFIANVNAMGGINKFTDNVLKDYHRTSSRNGILKSKAVLQWLHILKKYNIETIEDFRNKYAKNENIEAELKNVKGQNSGISAAYLSMLVGNRDLAKPDRMLIKFFSEQLGRKVEISEIQSLCESVTDILKSDFSKVDVRLLDNIIWNYQRRQSNKKKVDDK